MDEARIYEALGMEAPAQEAPAAEPAAEAKSEETGEQNAPGTENEAEAGTEAPSEGDGKTPSEEKPHQRDGEDARQAAGRRIREREAAAEARGRAAMQAEIDAVLKRMGMPNPQTGETVDNWEKLRDYDEGLSKARMAAGKGTEEDVRRVVREEMGQPGRSPGERARTGEDVAPEIASSAASGAENQAGRGPTEAEFAAEFAEIARMDPEMKDLGTILRSEAGPKFREYVAKGLNFVDAYTLAARARLSAKQAQAATEAAQVKAAGKEHMTATKSRGNEGDLPVPADEMEIFRALMPGTSDAEFRKYWNENRRKG